MVWDWEDFRPRVKHSTDDRMRSIADFTIHYPFYMGHDILGRPKYEQHSVLVVSSLGEKVGNYQAHLGWDITKQKLISVHINYTPHVHVKEIT